MESLTASLIKETTKMIEEVEKLGGMTKAVESGMPKQHIEASAAKRQALIDQVQEVIVGTNKYKAENVESLEIREIDNTVVREAQIEKLNIVKKNRDNQKVKDALRAISHSADTVKDNLLELSIEAARHRATVGEISSAMEKIWGRYSAPTQSISGVYSDTFLDRNEINDIQEKINSFAKINGRRPICWNNSGMTIF